MASSLGSMVVTLGANISDFELKMNRAQKAFTKFGRQTEQLGRQLTTRVTLPLLAVGAAAVTFATKMDNLKRGLTAVSGSSAETEKQLKRLREVAKLPGLGFEEAIKGSIRLQAAGFAATLAEDALRGFGNALATVGAGKAELDQVTRALSQIAAKGKISAEEINQIAEVVPQIRVVMQKAFGTSNSELLQKAGIDAQVFVRKVSDELLKLKQVVGGPANAFENLVDTVKLAAVNIGNALLPTVVGITDKLASLAEKLQNVDAGTMRAAVAFGITAAVIPPLLIVVGSLTAAAAALAAALGTTLLPIIAVGGPIAIAIAAVTALFAKTTLDMLAGASAADSLADSFRRLGGAIEGLARLQTGAALGDGLTKFFTVPKRGEVEVGKAGFPKELANRMAGDRFLIDVDKSAIDRQAMARRRAEIMNAPAIARPLAPLLKPDALKKLQGEQFDSILASKRFGFGSRVHVAQLAGGASNQIPQFDHTTGRRIDPRITAPGMNLNLQNSARLNAMGDARNPMGPQRQGILGRIGGGLKDFGGGVASQVGGVVAQFGPLAAAAAALRPVFEGLMNVLGPALKTIAGPLRTVGALLGTVILPVLKLLTPPMELLARAVSYLVEGIGWAIRAIGKAIDALPLISGGPIIRAGQEMIDGARTARKSLQTFGDAADAASRSLSNVANVMHINQLRHQIAGGGVTGGGGSGGGAGGGGRSQPGQRPAERIEIHVHGATDPVRVAEDVARVIERRRGVGGTTRLGLAAL